MFSVLGTCKDLNLALSPGLEELRGEKLARMLDGVALMGRLQAGPREAAAHSSYTAVRGHQEVCASHKRGES